MKAVRYHPTFCPEAKKDAKENGTRPFYRFDTSHDLSVIDANGERHHIGTFKHADWAYEVGKLIEKHGLSGIPTTTDEAQG